MINSAYKICKHAKNLFTPLGMTCACICGCHPYVVFRIYTIKDGTKENKYINHIIAVWTNIEKKNCIYRKDAARTFHFRCW